MTTGLYMKLYPSRYCISKHYQIQHLRTEITGNNADKLSYCYKIEFLSTIWIFAVLIGLIGSPLTSYVAWLR